MSVRIPRQFAVRSLLMVGLAGALFGYLGNSSPVTGGDNRGVEQRVNALEDAVLVLADDNAALRQRMAGLEDEVALLREIIAECCGVEPPPPPQCQLDEDCPAGQVCLNGRCVIDPTQDLDQDGFAIADGDCDDQNPDVYPGAPELENGIDDDCDFEIDEDFFF